ncbi:MAG: tRNA (adenosine(37)-N6)-dimethylallyltransferase MiaA [Candidatus Omnitrophica bacterium]|nr:tRNA (adenosine(37)-N6)-dimethylallyltransferase MiaA [Candidatus Omnitrophota bacterium]
MTHPPLVFIVGPTAVGKSEVGILLAKQIGGEIISGDAMQVYREINIASAKPTRDDLTKVKHHCLNLVSVTEDFNVARFRREALKAIEDILSRGRRPVIVGGSGMYVSVLIDGIFEGSAGDEHLREQLEEEIKIQGTPALHERLKSLDTKAAAKIHAHDAKRIVRALEVVLSTKSPISKLQSQRQGLWGQYPIRIFGLNRPRVELYRRLEARIDKMFEQGLVKEIQKLSTLSLSPTAQTLIGIPQVQGYLQGEYDLERAKYLMKLNTRHYVKRQLTWFRREKRLEWINVDNESAQDIVEDIIKKISA